MRSSDRNGPGVDDEREPGARTMLSRLLAVLGAFDTSPARLSLAEMTRRTGLPKTTVHRLAAELVHERLLVRDEQGLYALGMRLFEIGELVPVHRTLSSVALPIMEDLREATRKRVHLAVLDGIDVVYVEILGATSIDVGSRPGGRIPAHATGVGKVMLAYSPAATIRARIDAGLPPLTSRTIVSSDALIADLRKIRSIGMALDLEESHLGVSCVAAPVFGYNKRIRAGLSITGPTDAMDPGLLGPAVRTAAFTLSRAVRDAGL